MKAIGYVRVSREGHRGGDSFLSPELQRESIERVCHREGLELAEVVEELDKSGGDAARPLWNVASAIDRRILGFSTEFVGGSLDVLSGAGAAGLCAGGEGLGTHSK